MIAAADSSPTNSSTPASSSGRSCAASGPTAASKADRQVKTLPKAAFSQESDRPAAGSSELARDIARGRYYTVRPGVRTGVSDSAVAHTGTAGRLRSTARNNHRPSPPAWLSRATETCSQARRDRLHDMSRTDAKFLFIRKIEYSLERPRKRAGRQYRDSARASADAGMHRGCRRIYCGSRGNEPKYFGSHWLIFGENQMCKSKPVIALSAVISPDVIQAYIVVMIAMAAGEGSRLSHRRLGRPLALSAVC